MVNQNAGLDVLRNPMVQALTSCGPVGNLIANDLNVFNPLHFVLPGSGGGSRERQERRVRHRLCRRGKGGQTPTLHEVQSIF